MLRVARTMLLYKMSVRHRLSICLSHAAILSKQLDVSYNQTFFTVGSPHQH